MVPLVERKETIAGIIGGGVGLVTLMVAVVVGRRYLIKRQISFFKREEAGSSFWTEDNETKEFNEDNEDNMADSNAGSSKNLQQSVEVFITDTSGGHPVDQKLLATAIASQIGSHVVRKRQSGEETGDVLSEAGPIVDQNLLAQAVASTVRFPAVARSRENSDADVLTAEDAARLGPDAKARPRTPRRGDKAEGQTEDIIVDRKLLAVAVVSTMNIPNVQETGQIEEFSIPSGEQLPRTYLGDPQRTAMSGVSREQTFDVPDEDHHLCEDRVMSRESPSAGVRYSEQKVGDVVIAQISNLPEEGDAVIDVLVSDDDPPIFLKPPKVRTPTPHTPPLPENSLEHPKDHDVAREGPVQNLLGNEPVAPDRPFDEEGPTICDMERGYTNEESRGP